MQYTHEKKSALLCSALLYLSIITVNTASGALLFTNDLFDAQDYEFIIDGGGSATSDITLKFGAIANQTLTWDISNSRFHLSNDLLIDGTASTTGNTFTLDTDNSGGDITLEFGNALSRNLYWNNTLSRFEFTNALHVDGAFSINGTTITMDADNTSSGSDVSIIANQGSDNDGILRYNSTSNQWEISNNGGPFSPITTGSSLLSSLPSLSVRRTTSFTLTTAFTDVPLSTVDINTQPSILEHDTINTERILIKSDGLYLIYYNAVAGGSATSTHLMTARLQKNGTTTLPSSQTVNRNYQAEYSSNTATVLAQLLNGDYITLQLQRDGVSDITQQDITVSIIKLEGVEGPQGPQGLPGSVGMGTNETSFTLDQDNAGSGTDISIIANQGSDNNGTIRYNSTTNQWEISNNDGPFLPLLYSPQIAQVYESGTTTFNAATAISWDGTSSSLRMIDTNFTHSTSVNPSRLTVNSSGLYRITYSINWDTSTNTWRQALCQLYINGATTTPDAGVSYSFARNNTYDNATNATSFFYNLTSGDYIEIRCSSVGTAGNIITVAGESILSIEKIR